jgi:hypothetical protein
VEHEKPSTLYLTLNLAENKLVGVRTGYALFTYFMFPMVPPISFQVGGASRAGLSANSLWEVLGGWGGGGPGEVSRSLARINSEKIFKFSTHVVLTS